MDHREIAGRFNAAFGRPVADGGERGCSQACRAVARTIVVGGAAEPVYLPATGERPAIIRYTRDYAPSVLHELAHWCLAAPAERRHVDYGLVYEPPPRGSLAQARFYDAEVSVQGLERLLAEACGVGFRISTDNPGMDDWGAVERFETRVEAEYRRLLTEGPPLLACRVLRALNPRWTLTPSDTPRAITLAAAG